MIEGHQALYLFQQGFLPYCLGQESIDINLWPLCLLLWHSNGLNGRTDGGTLRLAGATDGTESGIVGQFMLALDTSFHILVV